MKIIAFLTSSSGGGTEITVVDNYTALLALPPTADTFYWCQNSQGTSWLPGSLGGTYYPKGIYYCLTTSPLVIQYIETPYQATQAEVDAGTVENKFISPKTFNDSAQLAAKANLSGAIFTGTISATNLSGTNTGDETQASILSKLGVFYLPFTPSSVVTGTTSETQVAVVEIPANTIKNLDNLRIYTPVIKTGTVGLCTVTYKLSTSATMPSGTTDRIAFVAASTGSLWIGMNRNPSYNSGNLIIAATTSSLISDLTTAAQAPSVVAKDNSVTLYLYVSITLGNSSDSAYLSGGYITNN